MPQNPQWLCSSGRRRGRNGGRERGMKRESEGVWKGKEEEEKGHR